MSAALDSDSATLASLHERELVAIEARHSWLLRARTPKRKGKQIPSPALDWSIYLFLAGRGFGKTEGMSQWLWWELWQRPGTIGHILAPTIADVRGTNFQGPAGLQAIVPPECLKGGSWETAYLKQDRELRFANGSLIRGFGAVEEAGRLRGPQCHRMICDELREFDRPGGNLEAALNNALFGLRLQHNDGIPARAVMGTTPKPIPFLKRFAKRKDVRVVTGTSYENIDNLSVTYRNQLLALAGTLMGRQEIDGAFIDEESDLSIIKRHWIKLWPADKKLPEFTFIMEVYDTAASEENYDAKKQQTDPTASIVLGVFNVEQVFGKEGKKKLGVRGKYAALVLDAWSERLGLPDLLEKARAQHRTKWGPSPGRRADVVLIEDKSSGPGLRQFMAKWGVPTWPHKPRRDKATRLHGVSPIIAQGGLFVPESSRGDRRGLPRDWCEPMLEEVCAFAGEGSTEHDDFVDCISSGFEYLHQRSLLAAEPEEQYVDLEEKEEAEQRRAQKIYEQQQRKQMGNPYG